MDFSNFTESYDLAYQGHSTQDENLDGGYHTMQGHHPYISSVYREFLHDGSRFQNQPWKGQHNLIHQIFYSPANVKYIQSEIRKKGFNNAPNFSTLSGFMDQIYTNDMPYGAYDRLDPNRNNKSVDYALSYVERLNEQLLKMVVQNMSLMRHSREQYLRDSNSFQGVLKIDRPMYVDCRSNGPPIRRDFFLP